MILTGIQSHLLSTKLREDFLLKTLTCSFEKPYRFSNYRVHKNSMILAGSFKKRQGKAKDQDGQKVLLSLEGRTVGIEQKCHHNAKGRLDVRN